MATSSAIELDIVHRVSQRLQDLLQHARTIKPEATVEPPLPIAAFAHEIDALHDDFVDQQDQVPRYYVVETAVREIFYNLIHSTSIDGPAFVAVWDLLDIVLMAGDNGKCTPELVCWLLEELLDSQTTDGCRIVFDYLETRRERLAQKDFHKKNLIFLRSCNELLRRLSRAEDAIFCGRVFFFLFQTFPLGDKSSVNLRGEFHLENTTVFDTGTEPSDPMELDDQNAQASLGTDVVKGSETPVRNGEKPEGAKPPAEEETPTDHDLYPIFWQLQHDFSDPSRLFESEKFSVFRTSLASTVAKFKRTPTVVQAKRATGHKGVEGAKDEESASIENGDYLADIYNPKYLTSRDLFVLELSDLAFQRHILVQALILIDFLLSLTEKAKKKLDAVGNANKSLLYAFVLSDEDSKWATATRATITSYLGLTPEGRQYCRMVETVLARDKNWVRWKVEGCPSIIRGPVPTEQELAARKGARDLTRPRKVPEKPMGAMDLGFLDGAGVGDIDVLKLPARYVAPSIEELVNGVQSDELDLEMAMDDAEKSGLENALANKTWRALRQARSSNLVLLDKIDPNKSLAEVLAPRNSEVEILEQHIDTNGAAVSIVADDVSTNDADVALSLDDSGLDDLKVA